MRILVAPDKFAGTLTAVQAAEAIAEGWRRTVPADEVVVAPMADGGPGFVDVLHAVLGGELHVATVRGPLDDLVPATVLLTGDTAYVESAHACGLDLMPAGTYGPELVRRASTYGVGQLVAHALDAGATRVVVGLGGSGTNDAGAGLLAALGAVGEPAEGLTGGPDALPELGSLDLDPARERLAGVELIAATDVDNPLLGLRGATNVFGPQKGIVDTDDKLAVDAALAGFAGLVGLPGSPDRRLADAKGAGAAGGLGFALMLLGGRAESGFTTVAEAVGLADLVASADLVVTGEGSLDWQSMSGKVVSGVAGLAGPALRPCIALAGVVKVGNRELRANGIEAAYSLVDVVGADDALGQPGRSLASVAERVARTWSRT